MRRLPPCGLPNRSTLLDANAFAWMPQEPSFFTKRRKSDSRRTTVNVSEIYALTLLEGSANESTRRTVIPYHMAYNPAKKDGQGMSLLASLWSMETLSWRSETRIYATQRMWANTENRSHHGANSVFFFLWLPLELTVLAQQLLSLRVEDILMICNHRNCDVKTRVQLSNYGTWQNHLQPINLNHLGSVQPAMPYRCTAFEGQNLSPSL